MSYERNREDLQTGRNIYWRLLVRRVLFAPPGTRTTQFQGDVLNHLGSYQGTPVTHLNYLRDRHKTLLPYSGALLPRDQPKSSSVALVKRVPPLDRDACHNNVAMCHNVGPAVVAAWNKCTSGFSTPNTWATIHTIIRMTMFSATRGNCHHAQARKQGVGLFV